MVFAIGLVILFFEVIGGLLSGSLALLSDAGHILADLAAVTVAIAVDHQVRRNKMAENKWRGGGAIFQGWLLLAIAAWLIFEAVGRFGIKYQIAGMMMLLVAILGAIGNYIQYLILESGEHHLTNRGINWHVLSDLWQRVAVIIAAIIVDATGWFWADLAASFIIVAVMIVWGSILINKGFKMARS